FFEPESAHEQNVVSNFRMQIEWEMSAVNGEIIFERELQLPAQRFGDGTQARPKHSMVNNEQVSAALRAFLQSAAGEIHRRRNFRYLAGILQLQAVERILVILNFAKPQIGIAITNDLVQRGHIIHFAEARKF